MPLKFWGTSRKQEYTAAPEIDSTPLLQEGPCSADDVFFSAETPSNIMNTIFNLKENPLKTSLRFNKVFCSTWIGDDVVFGTKDSQVTLYNAKDKSLRSLDLPHRSGVSTSPEDVGTHVATANADQSALVVGGRHAEDLVLFNTNTFKHESLLVGHSDWVYGAEWIDVETLVSGGRDSKLMVWSLNARTEAKENNVEHLNGKFLMKTRETARAMKIHPYNRDILHTVTSDGLLSTLDLRKACRIAKMNIHSAQETVCLTIDGANSCVFVGGKRRVYKYDPRVSGSKAIATIRALDSGFGVRTLEMDSAVVSMGSGNGQISLWDTRTCRYLTNGRKKYLTVERGWIRNDSRYQVACESIHKDAIPSCIYTQAYHPTRRMVFVAGGPTMATLFGSLVSVFNW